MLLLKVLRKLLHKALGQAVFGQVMMVLGGEGLAAVMQAVHTQQQGLYQGRNNGLLVAMCKRKLIFDIGKKGFDTLERLRVVEGKQVLLVFVQEAESI